MLRRPLLLVALCVAVLASASSALADGFNPGTQSHYGACSRETTSVKLAVHDYAANGVLADFAHLVGFHGSHKSLTSQMRKRLVVAPVLHRVVTANHGCDDEGQWFAVGPRTLNKGELVGVKVPKKLRAHLCGRRHHKGCKRVVLSPHVVFPITCWNPNMGSAKVVVYVHKHHKKKRKPKRHVKPKKEEAAPPPPPAPVPAPSAVASQKSCAEGAGVLVTLSNASTATGDAVFLLNGASYGPIAPGASQTVSIALNVGESTSISVTSGTSVLINGQSFSNLCKAEPSASVAYLGCVYPEEPLEGEEELPYGAEVEVTLVNGSGATLPASFVVQWTPPGLFSYESGPTTPEPVESTYGPIAPGSEQKFILTIESALAASPVKVTSGSLVVEEDFGEEELSQQKPFGRHACIPL